MRKEITGALDELVFMRNLVMMFGKIDKVVMNQYIPATLSYLFCTCFASLVGDKKQVTEFSSKLDIALPRVRKLIHCEVRILYANHRPQILPQVRAAKIMDQEVVDFFDRPIDTLRKEHMETLVQELTFLRFNLLDVLQSYSEEMESLFFPTWALIIEMAFKIRFCRSETEYEYVDSRSPLHPPKERAIMYWRSHLPDLMDAVDSLKQQATDLFKKSYGNFSVPSSNHMESVNCLARNLKGLIDHKAESIAPLKHQIETYYREMLPVRNFLVALEQMPNSPIGFFMARFIESANQARFIIDSFLAGEGPLWHHKLGLFVVTNDIKMAHEKMESLVLNNMKASESDINRRISSGLPSSVAENPHKDVNETISSKDQFNPKPNRSKLVGVKDAQLQIIELLTGIGGSRNRQIISIVGMPGLGKTTVANSVYQHLSVNKHFHVRAWCCVSQVYNRETLLAEILSQVVVGESNSCLEEVSGADLAQLVYRNLKGRRYLIVIDDIWDIAVWHDLERTFPNDDNGSRILFTTQKRHVAQQANGRHYNLNLLSDKKSCKLLWLKVFDGETCPPELSSLSRHIAKKCKGLPLAVILVAGILRRTERSKESWEQVAAEVKTLGGEHGKHSEIMWLEKILKYSYMHLPLFLRPCFLYFAAFSEDTCISVSKLIRLWISEGLVQEISLCHKNLEEEADSYLDELIDRSLVMIAKRSSNGGVKACRVHDILRVFCLTISGQERLAWEESMLGGTIRVHLRSLMYYNMPNEETNSGIGRRDPRSAGPVFTDKLHSRKAVISEGNGTYQPRGLNHNFIFQHEFLKVLDLGKVRMGSSVVTSDIIMITTLVHLRFLGIRPRSTEIPAEIGNLQKLETFILTGVIGYIKLPESLWNLSSLRHVLMDHGFFSFQHCGKTFLENFSGLYDFKSVSTLSLQHGDDDVKCFLRKLPCLQKLSCRFEYSWDNVTNCCLFPVLDFLYQLEWLKVFFSGAVRLPCKFSFPSNLKKLSLLNSRLPWDEISVIVRQLPNLEVLKLLNNAFEGREWGIGDGEFPKLKFLKLESLDLEVWNVDAEQLPCLQQLVVLSCPQLEEIPCCFGEISTLQSIEIKWCSSSAMDSVNQILETQRDFSNQQFKVSRGGCTIV